MSVLTHLKRAYQKFDEGSIVEEIAQSFTIITLINSIMMIVGWDQPKQGAFAYLHLLGRLGIIILVFIVWEYSEILSYFKDSFIKENVILSLRRWIDSLSRKWFSMTAVLFTIGVVLVAIVVVLFQEMLQPVGDLGLYQNLLFFYVALTIVFYVYSKK